MKLRVASYNLWYHKAYPEVAELVRSQHIDIFFIQECVPTELEGKLAGLTLADARIYTHHKPFDNPVSVGAIKTTFWLKTGMAIYYNPALMKLVGVTSHKLSLPWSERKGGRFMQLARFELRDGSELLAANIHLSALWSTNRSRRKQLEGVMEVVDGNRPVVMGGDFNYPLMSKGLRSFMASFGLAECGSHNGSRTHISKLVKGKFDHIFISDDLKESDYAILPFNASDHAPVVVTVDV